MCATKKNIKLGNDFSKINAFIVPSLLEIMEKKDQTTLIHSSKVQRLIDLMAPELIRNKIISQEEPPYLWVASIIHDIGKIFIDDKILESQRKLGKFEYKVMRYHPIRGYHMLKELGLPKKMLDAVKHHHERWDGKTRGRYPGYPDGLKGKKIPIYARIISIADAYEAMVSKRPYKKPIPPEVAMIRIMKGSGSQFDPQLVDIFLKVMREKIQRLI